MYTFEDWLKENKIELSGRPLLFAKDILNSPHIIGMNHHKAGKTLVFETVEKYMKEQLPKALRCDNCGSLKVVDVTTKLDAHRMMRCTECGENYERHKRKVKHLEEDACHCKHCGLFKCK